MISDSRDMRFYSRFVQLPKPNYYSSKICECCGPYHGNCSIKQQNWIEMEEYEIYPEDESDFECDGCKQFQKCNDDFIFTGQNPKIDCPHFRACNYCQGTGVYANQLLEVLGSIELHVRENAEDETDYFEIFSAVHQYWHRNYTSKTKEEYCEFDNYILDKKNCPFCHGEGYLHDMIEAVLVSRFTNLMMEYVLLEDASHYLAALDIWQNMRSQKKLFTSDFNNFAKPEVKV